MIKLSVSKDFTEIPGPRFKKQGSHSAEEFRETILIPKFEEALKAGCKLEVNLDDVYGYFDSFLEEAFGGLARKYGKEKVLATLILISNDDPEVIDLIQEDIDHAED